MFDPDHCADCSRLLRQADDPLSDSLDFDCAGCIYLYGFGGQLPDMSPEQLRLWLRPILEAEQQRRAMVTAALEGAAASGRLDRDNWSDEHLIVIGSQRLIQHGMTEDEARAKVIEAFSKPLPFRIPDIDEL